LVAWLVIGLVEVEAQFFVSFGPAFDGIDLARQELLQIARFVPLFRQTLESAFSLADPVASVAINMPLQKELCASSRLPRRRVQDAYRDAMASHRISERHWVKS